MINIGINGACGRMGRLLIQLANQRKDMKLALALEAGGHPDLGKDAGIVAGLGKPLGVKVTSLKECQSRPGGIKNVDVIIDFSLPRGVPDCLAICKKNKIALVEGTTGLDARIIAVFKQAGKTIPCLVSPNFSTGANWMMELAEQTARQLGGRYDIEITETHHKTKKDKPSGTAIRLAQAIKDGLKDSAREIPIHALRMGEVVGEHKVYFGGPGEVLEIVHRVQSRNAFADGALTSAKFLAQAKPGFYNLKDVLANRIIG
jgi:4-hydroxy-tetrahydrodipicolinate reductase